MNILIVDDEQPIRMLIKFNLERAQYKTMEAATGAEALEAVQKHCTQSTQAEGGAGGAGGIDMVVLDLMLPDMSGLDVCRALKGNKAAAQIPIVMVTARAEDDDIVKGLELGADDYITKPFSPRVLVARVKSVLRRRERGEAGEADSPVVKCGPIVIDTARHEASIQGRSMDLSATEFDLLLFLSRHAGQVFSRRQIIDAIKGDDYPVTERAVDVQILSIRRKIAKVSSDDLIETIRGVGYRMRDSEDNSK